MPPEIHDDYLPEKQLQLLQFLREYYQKNGAMPRLNVITEKLGVTNKAALDLIDALEKKGRLVRDGDVQSIRLLPTKDIFISYSSKDKEFALQIVEAFKRVGYTVWLDDMDILVGEDIVRKVFHGIRECRFFVVILSENSVRSHWVQEEISSARLLELEKGQTVVLPLVISDNLNLPAALRHKKHLKMSEKNIQEGMRKLLESIVLLSLHGTLGPAETLGERGRNADREYEETVKHIKTEGFPEDKAYKEWIIHPLPLGDKLIPKGKIEELVNRHRVKLNRYGGMGFPHETEYHQIGRSILRDGFYMYWSWGADGLFTQKACYDYWRMFENGTFIARESLLEDSMFPDQRILSLEWLEMDIVRPMLFMQNLKKELKIDTYKFTLRFHGLKDRKLSILNRSRSGFHWDYIAKDDELELTATIDSSVDLLETALEMTMNTIELFNWKNPNVEVSRRDLKELLAGNFPE